MTSTSVLAAENVSAPSINADGNDYGHQLYERITGAPLSHHRSDIADWNALIQKADWTNLAIKATKESNFVNVTALYWATRYFSQGKSSVMPLDDGLALLVGSLRDNLDARLLLTGDYGYQPDPRLGLQASLSDNQAYSTIEQSQLPLSSSIAYQTPQWSLSGYEDAGGLLTTRSWASRNYDAGTNRRAVRVAIETFLCRPNDSWEIPDLSQDRIRQDVDRAPGGDARVFQQSCRLCHGTLDALGGAFAHMDFTDSTFTVSSDVVPKYLQHPDKYPEGYVTTDDTWINSLAITTNGLGTSFGWRNTTDNNAQGHGVQQLGKQLSDSKSFSACLVKNVYSTLCLGDKDLNDPVIQQIATDFESQDAYKLKDLFVRVALRPECLAPPSTTSSLFK